MDYLWFRIRKKENRSEKVLRLKRQLIKDNKIKRKRK